MAAIGVMERALATAPIRMEGRREEVFIRDERLCATEVQQRRT